MFNIKKSKEITFQVLSKKIYTTELLKILEQVSYSGFANLEGNKYIPVLEESLKLLGAVSICWELVSVREINLKDITPLTERQRYCFAAVINHLEKDEFSHAYHELHDCVYDYSNGKEDGDYININEYIAFKFLIEYFLKKLGE